MRREDFGNKWNEYKWEAKMKWGKLTDEDIAGVNGQYEQLSHKIQQRYGWDKKQADQEINSWCAGCEKKKWRNSKPKQEQAWEGQEEWWKESGEPKQFKGKEMNPGHQGHMGPQGPQKKGKRRKAG